MIGRRGAIAKRSTAKPQTVGEKLATRAKKFVAMRKTEKAKTNPSAFARKRGGGGVKAVAAVAAPPAAAPAAAAAAAPLPAGWAEAKTEDGQVRARGGRAGRGRGAGGGDGARAGGA